MARMVVNGRDRAQYNIDHKFSNFSDFQKARLLEISERSGFEHFCLPPHDNVKVCIKHGPPCECSPESPRKLGPFTVAWYEDGKIHGQKIGVKRTLTPIISPKNLS